MVYKKLYSVKTVYNEGILEILWYLKAAVFLWNRFFFFPFNSDLLLLQLLWNSSFLVWEASNQYQRHGCWLDIDLHRIGVSILFFSFIRYPSWYEFNFLFNHVLPYITSNSYLWLFHICKLLLTFSHIFKT